MADLYLFQGLTSHICGEMTVSCAKITKSFLKYPKPLNMQHAPFY